MIISARFPLFHDLFDSRQNKGARVKRMAHDQVQSKIANYVTVTCSWNENM